MLLGGCGSILDKELVGDSTSIVSICGLFEVRRDGFVGFSLMA